MVDFKKFNIAVESVSTGTVQTDKTISENSESIKVSGLALPFNVASRNGFMYGSESVKRTFQSLIGRPVLFNHNSESVIGHVEDVTITEQGMTYKMDIDRIGPLGWVARKLERGDLKNVSIQASFDPQTSFIDEEGVTHANIHEFYELSVVTIPGFADTTATVVEMLKEKQKSECTVKQSEAQIMTEEEQPKTDAPTEEPKEEPKKDVPSMEERMAKLEAAADAMSKQLEACAAKIKEMEPKEKEEPKEEPPKDEVPADSNDKKVEEAIKKDKQSVMTESFNKVDKIITTEDLKREFTELKLR